MYILVIALWRGYYRTEKSTDNQNRKKMSKNPMYNMYNLCHFLKISDKQVYEESYYNQGRWRKSQWKFSPYFTITSVFIQWIKWWKGIKHT